MPKRYSKYILWGGTIVIVLGLLVLALMPKKVPVSSAHAVTGNLIETITAEGTTRYQDTYLVSAPISGMLTRTEFEVGAKLHDGEVLADLLPPTIDPRQVEELTARLESAQSLEQEASHHLAEARTTLDQAQREETRAVALYQQSVLTKDQLEHDSDAVQQAQQDVHAADARLRSAHHDAEAIRASMANKSTGFQIPLVSPVDGILLDIYEKNAREVAASAPLFEVGDTTRLEVVIDLLSSDAPRVHIGDSVLVTVPGIDRRLRARVRLIEPDAYIKISPLGIEEKRVNVITSLIDRATELGSTYRIDATMVIWSGDNLLKVPISALFRNGKEWSVWKIVDGKAKEQKISIGHMNDTEAEVLDGLSASDVVIVHPGNEIAEGVRVKETNNPQ